MKYSIFTIILTSIIFNLFPSTTSAQKADTSRSNTLLLNEVEIISPKETGRLQKIPVSMTTLSEEQIERNNIFGIKEISSQVANLYIPDYGTKLTSAIYIRGVGSRMGSSVGFYVDNVPYPTQNSFDFSFFDIQSIEALRGPQGTLYGRNSLGGIIHINTLSPMQFQGVKAAFSYGNRNFLDGKASYYHKFNEKIGFSVAGNYHAFGGFFKNEYTGKYVDAEWSAAARGRIDWYINKNLKLNYIVSYDHSNQDGYAYGAYNKTTQEIEDVNYNAPAMYRRDILNNSILLEYQTRKFKLTSSTGYQYLNDSMMLDQDFTAASVFTLTQTQKLNTVNEEILLRSTTNSNFQWIAGAFGFYETLETHAPVTFEEAGIAMIQRFIPEEMPITILNDNIYVEGQFETPSYGAAVFAQGTLKSLFKTNLSFTAGLRLDYEKNFLDAYTATDITYSLPPMMSPEPVTVTYKIEGAADMDFMPLLPKFSLQYDFSEKASVYVSISMGYKAGGYNIQMFSDLLQNKIQKDPMGRDTSKMDLQGAVAFKPEYSWNYELGAKAVLVKNRLDGYISLFFIQLRDQQIAEFAPTGAGRMIKNAGESRSYGLEASLRAVIVKNLNAGVSYGFTMAELTKYTVLNKDSTTTDFSGNRVPFAPQNTLSIAVDYTLNINKKALDRIVFDAQCVGAGKIYWTEANDINQSFYGLLNAKITLEKKWFQLSLWGKNLTNSDYLAFYFETMGNPFAQKGKPLQFGATLSAKF